MKTNKKRLNKKVLKRKVRKLIRFFLFVTCLFILFFAIGKKKLETTKKENTKAPESLETFSAIEENKVGMISQIDDWRLKLVNYENPLSEDYPIELANIDKTRQFDKRAIKQLNTMREAMSKDKIKNIWIQSAYRSVAYQQQLYDKSMNKYLRSGKTEGQAKILTEKLLARPGNSEHHLGLAVDFNYVDENFDKTEAFKWLQKNAWNYGFILRYPKEKEEITKILYEPWHWRYVGKEHASKIKELGMCLEEYIEYLQGGK